MKFAYGMIGYIAGASALVALGVAGVSYAVAPYGTSREVMKSERAAEKPAETMASKTAALATAVSDAERVPTWIAPTHKYPVSALNMKTAPRAKQLAHEGYQGRGDWRLNERQVSFNSSVAMSSYAETRIQPSYQEAPRHREPMQFRERTEPR